MKIQLNRKLLWTAFVLLIAIGSAMQEGRSQQGNVEWRFENGPWSSGYVPDFAIGYQGSQPVVYVTASGYIGKSTNYGESWQKIYVASGFFANTVDCDAEKPDVLFVGSLTEGNSFDYVYKSTNGGISWTNVTSNLSHPMVTCVAIQPGTNNQTVYLGCDGSLQPQPVGILWKTTNGGQNWSLVSGFPQTQAIVSEILFNPRDHSEIFVSARDDYEDQNGGVWRSTDNGQTWLPRDEGMVSRAIGALAIDPARLNRLYAGTRLFGSPTAQYFYVSTNSGERWTPVIQPFNLVSFGMTVDAQSGAIFVATISMYERPTNRSTGVLSSTNFGMSWNPVNSGIYDRWIFSIKTDPRQSGRVFCGTVAAIYRSDNSGLSWSEKNVGLNRVPCISVSVSGTNFLTALYNFSSWDPLGSPMNPHQLLPQLGLFPDPFGSICLTTNSGSSWRVVQEETALFFGSEALISPTGTLFVLGHGSWQIFANRPQLYRSDDQGETWVPYYWMPNGVAHHLHGLSIAIDPQLPRVIYAGTDSLPQAPNYPLMVKSTDDGISWTELAGAVPVANAKIYSIAVDRTSSVPGHESNVIYAAGSNMGVRKSTDAGQTWMPKGLESYTIRTLALNPTNGYVLFAGAASGEIFRSVDAATTWEQVYNAIGILSIRIHPQVPSTLYALQRSGEQGQSWLILRSTQYGNAGSWQPYGSPLSAPPHKLEIDPTNPNRIYAATNHGVYSIPHIWTGELAANATWRSGQTYVVEGRLNVPEGVTLTIQPGAVVQFDAGASLAVYGSLRAVGTANKPIRFELMESARIPWYGIVLHKPTESTLSYCAISHAQYGVVASTFRVIQYPTITNCTITKCAVGIYLWGPLSHEQNYGIRSNRIEECDFGIVTNSNKYGSEPVLEDNVVRTSGKAGGWFARSSPVLLRNRFEHSRQEGILCTDGGNAQFGRNMRESEPGRNIVANNASVQLFAQYASPFLGLVDDEISCNLIAGGLNRVYHNSDAVGRVHATGSGTVVQADRNFWGYPVLDQWFIADHDAKIIRRCPLRDEETEEIRMLLAAAALRADGLYEQAIALYDRVVSDYPYTPEAAGALAACAETYKDYVAASGDTTLAAEQIAYLAEVASEHPADEVKELAKLYLARAYEDKDNPAEALALYEELLQEISEPDLKAIVYRSIVGLYAAQGDLEQARATLDEMSTHVAGNRHVEITRFDLALFTGETFAEVPMGKGAAGDATAGGHAPTRYSLEQNFPNPFNPTTEIWFKLGADGFITLKLYDVVGREVKTLAEGTYEAGYYSVTLNASGLPSGVYFYRLTTADFTQVRKMMLVK